MTSQNFVTRIVLTALLSALILLPGGIAHALGISPPVLNLDPIIPGHKKTISIDMTRIRTDYVSRIDVIVSEKIAPFVSVVSADNLIMKYGEKTRKIFVVVDGTSLKSGEEHKGTITYKEDKQIESQVGSTANLPGVMMDITIKVSEDQTKLLLVDSTSFAWNEQKKVLKYTYTQRNDRYEQAQVKKIRFHFASDKDPDDDQEVREVMVDGDALNPGDIRPSNGELILDSEIAGGVTVSMEFIDQNGKTVDKTTPFEIGVNSGVAAKNSKSTRYTLFAVISLSIAGLFMLDYMYIKRKNRRR